jgi:hypothetical protein
MGRGQSGPPVNVRKLLGAALAFSVVVMAWRTNYLAAIEANPTLALQSVGIGVLCLWTASRLQIGICLIAGLALRLLLPIHVTYYAGSVIATLGLSGFCGLCLLIYWVGGERKQLLRVLLLALIFLTLNMMLSSLLKLAALWNTRRYDLGIYAMDSANWDGVVAFLGSLLARHAWMFHFEETVYYALPGVIILVFAFHTYRSHDLEINLLGLYLTLAILGFLLYFVIPACGPIYAFAKLFPFALPPVGTAALASDVFKNSPNAMPPLHFASALMLYWNSRPWRGLRIFTFLFLIFTGVATLGSGEHYVTDLVVAIPFAVALQTYFGAASNKIAVVAFSSILVSIWFLAILIFPVGGAPPWLLWALTLGSIASPALLSIPHASAIYRSVLRFRRRMR